MTFILRLLSVYLYADSCRCWRQVYGKWKAYRKNSVSAEFTATIDCDSIAYCKSRIIGHKLWHKFNLLTVCLLCSTALGWTSGEVCQRESQAQEFREQQAGQCLCSVEPTEDIFEEDLKMHVISRNMGDDYRYLCVCVFLEGVFLFSDIGMEELLCD